MRKRLAFPAAADGPKTSSNAGGEKEKPKKPETKCAPCSAPLPRAGRTQTASEASPCCRRARPVCASERAAEGKAEGVNGGRARKRDGVSSICQSCKAEQSSFRRFCRPPPPPPMEEEPRANTPPAPCPSPRRARRRRPSSRRAVRGRRKGLAGELEAPKGCNDSHAKKVVGSWLPKGARSLRLRRRARRNERKGIRLFLSL